MGRVIKKVELNLNWSETIKEFIEWKRTIGTTKYVQDSMRRALNQFFRDRTEFQLADTKSVKREIQSFLCDKQAGYYNKQLQALRKFFEYLIIERDLITDNP